MRRFALFLLVLTLPLCAAADWEMTPEDAEEMDWVYPSPVTVFHTLADIPWGTEKAESMRLMEALWGVPMEPYPEEPEDDTSYCAPPYGEESAVSLYGQPVSYFYAVFRGGEEKSCPRPPSPGSRT